MKLKKIALSILLFVLLASSSIFILRYHPDYQTAADNGPSKKITVGSKNFTENLIVAELYALALEDMDFVVNRAFNIAGALVHNALVTKEIDLYPEYTGTGLLSILKQPMETDPDKVYATVKQKYLEEFNLVWLDYALANDSQGLVISTKVAQQLGIKTISDLQKHAPSLRFASQGQFDFRDDGIVGLTKVYGPFNWKSSQVFENSLKYSILLNDEADVTPAYTTEGRLINVDQFTLLEDDKQFWPPYNLAPVIHQELLLQYPEIGYALNDISKELTTPIITKLNAQVDVEGKDFKEVAKQFYDTIKGVKP